MKQVSTIGSGNPKSYIQPGLTVDHDTHKTTADANVEDIITRVVDKAARTRPVLNHNAGKVTRMYTILMADVWL